MTHDMRRLLRQRTTTATPRLAPEHVLIHDKRGVGARFARRGDARREGVSMMICSERSFAVCLLAGVVASISPAYAGPADTPLPTFSDGKPAVAVYTAEGVIKGGNLETDFVCTNVDAVAVDIGLEVFDETGALRNSVHAGSGAFLNVGPGKTVTVGTAATAVLHEDQTLTLNTAGGGAGLLPERPGRGGAASQKNTR